MNTLLLTIAIIIVIVAYPFYMHIVEIFKATAWVNVIKRSFTKTKIEENEREEK